MNSCKRLDKEIAKLKKRYKNWTNPVKGYFKRVSTMDGSTIDYDPVKTQLNQIIIGMECDGDIMGFSLTGGAIRPYEKNDTFAYSIARFDIVEIPNFLEDYECGGKCFIDPEHRFFKHDFDMHEKEKSCKACGAEYVVKDYTGEIEEILSSFKLPTVESKSADFDKAAHQLQRIAWMKGDYVWVRKSTQLN